MTIVLDSSAFKYTVLFLPGPFTPVQVLPHRTLTTTLPHTQMAWLPPTVSHMTGMIMIMIMLNKQPLGNSGGEAAIVQSLWVQGVVDICVLFDTAKAQKLSLQGCRSATFAADPVLRMVCELYTICYRNISACYMSLPAVHCIDSVTGST